MIGGNRMNRKLEDVCKGQTGGALPWSSKNIQKTRMGDVVWSIAQGRKDRRGG